jgi:hypothetical protein
MIRITRNQKAQEERENSAFSILVTAALKSKNDTIPYPDFIQSLKGSYEVHPIVRLAAWVTMVYDSQGLPVPNLDPLLQLDLIDQVRFPLVHSSFGSPSSLRTCDAFCARGDYSNLAWMKEAVSHGYSMDWKAVKGVWNNLFITSASEFHGLLSVAPDPSACLSAVHPKNLSLLIESSNDSEFAKQIVHYYEFNPSEAQNPDSPYFTACWFLFRNQPRPFSKTILERNHDSFETTLATFKWASQYGFNKITLINDVQERKEFIRETLNELTAYLLSKEPKIRKQIVSSPTVDSIVSLWSQTFSSMLVLGCYKKGANEIEGVPYIVGLILANAQYPPNDNWPQLVKVLSAILHHRGESEQVNPLIENEFFRKYLNASVRDEQHEFSLPKEPFVSGLMETKGSLSKEWQIRLLTTKGVRLPDKYCHSEGLNKLKMGLYSLRSLDDIKIDEGLMKSELKSMYERSVKKETQMEWTAEQGLKQRQINEMRFLTRVRILFFFIYFHILIAC